MKRLYVQRLDLGAMAEATAGNVLTLSLECWRYTLTVYGGTKSGNQFNGVDIGQVVDNAFSAGAPSPYVERVGGSAISENSVKEQLNISAIPPLYATIVVERWIDEN